MGVAGRHVMRDMGWEMMERDERREVWGLVNALVSTLKCIWFF